MLIRTEAPADIMLIDALLKSVFSTDAQAKQVMMLRENSHFTLSLVACTDMGEVVGHLVFSPIQYEGEELGWQMLGPVAIKPEYNTEETLANMVKQGLDSLYEFGYSSCFVLTDETELYQRLGFAPQDQFSLQFSSGQLQQNVLAIELSDGTFDNKQGNIQSHYEFCA